MRSKNNKQYIRGKWDKLMKKNNPSNFEILIKNKANINMQQKISKIETKIVYFLNQIIMYISKTF